MHQEQNRHSQQVAPQEQATRAPGEEITYPRAHSRGEKQMADDTKIMGSIEHSLGQFECKEQGWRGFGSLTFNPNEGGRLKLFRPESTNPAPSDSLQINEAIRSASAFDVEEIEGQIEGRKRVKLINCLSHNIFYVGFPLTDVNEFSFNSLFVTDGNDGIPSKFDAVEIRLRHQDAWVGPPSEGLIPISEWVHLAENPSHDVRIPRPDPETFRICLPEYEFLITRFYGVSASFGQMPRFSSEPSSSLRIEFKRPTSLSAILEVVNRISSLISISLQTATPLTKVNLFNGERKIQWYGRLPEGRENTLPHFEGLHSFDGLGRDGVKKWLETVHYLSEAVNLLLRHLYQNGTSYVDTSFADVYRAMETIVVHFAGINDRRSGWNKKVLKSLLDEVKGFYVIAPEIASEAEWIDSVIRTRHEELTHKRVDRRKERSGKILKGDKLFYTTQSLRQLTIIYLLLKCGVNENFIRNLYEYRGVIFNCLQKSNPEEAAQELGHNFKQPNRNTD